MSTTTTARRDEGLRFILTHDDYSAAGVVLINNARWIGFDTSGSVIFDRKDFDGMQAAAKGKKLRTIAPGYYGIEAGRPEDVPAPQYRAHVEAERARIAAEHARVEAERAEWLPLGKPRADARNGAHVGGRELGVIGDLSRSHTGNTILRVGRLTHGEDGWEQTEHVVLDPSARDWLIEQLQAHARIAPAGWEKKRGQQS